MQEPRKCCVIDGRNSAMQQTILLIPSGPPAQSRSRTDEAELTHPTSSVAKGNIPHEDILRANIYAFLARALARAPDSAFMDEASSLTGDDSPIGQGFAALVKVAGRLDLDTVEREYHDLFIGVGRGELLPYASYYLTGFLNEKPLAKLRNTMSDLGIERDPDIVEPEDHVAAIFDMMAGLIGGAFGEPADLTIQKSFFDTHVQSWATYFFRDLESADTSVFYAPVGTIGKAFLEIEAMGFTMDSQASA